MRSFHLTPLPTSPTSPCWSKACSSSLCDPSVICYCHCHCRCHCDPRRRTHRTHGTPQPSTRTRTLEWPAARTNSPLQTTDPQSQPWTPRAFVTASRPRSTPTLPSASKRSSTSSMCVCPYPCPRPCPPPGRGRGRLTDRATGRGAARLHRWPAECAAAGAGARHPPVK